MQKKIIAGLVVIILAVSILAGFIFMESAPEEPLIMQNIVIQPDGNIHPSNAPIQREGNLYTLTNNIYGTIRIQKSNIILNGAGYTLSGPYNGSQVDVWVVGDGPTQSPDVVAEYIIGVDIGASSVEGIIIENLNVKNFSIGMYMWTKNNTVTGNRVSESIVGIMLSGSNNSVTGNYISNNKQGLFFGFNGEEVIPDDIIVHHNAFDNNIFQINGCLCEEYPEDEEIHTWDDGKEGNYWSDYTGSDNNQDGIGDTPYIIDPLNQDRYPLMKKPSN